MKRFIVSQCIETFRGHLHGVDSWTNHEARKGHCSQRHMFGCRKNKIYDNWKKRSVKANNLRNIGDPGIAKTLWNGHESHTQPWQKIINNEILTSVRTCHFHDRKSVCYTSSCVCWENLSKIAFPVSSFCYPPTMMLVKFLLVKPPMLGNHFYFQVITSFRFNTVHGDCNLSKGLFRSFTYVLERSVFIGFRMFGTELFPEQNYFRTRIKPENSEIFFRNSVVFGFLVKNMKYKNFCQCPDCV